MKDSGKFLEDYKNFVDFLQSKETVESQILKNLQVKEVSSKGGESWMRLEISVKSEYLNGYGGVFGGAMAAIMDLSASVLSFYLDPRVSSTMELNVTYVGVARLGETLSVQVFSPKAGKNILFTTIEVRSKGKVIALATNTRTFAAGLQWRKMINSPKL
jgi:uncharacterized protein (TIGR00369 family)